MRRGFSSLHGLIADGLRHYHLEHGVKTARAVVVWDTVAGPGVAAQTRADIVRDGILWVLTPSSAWSQELTMLREQLVAGINNAVGGEVVKDIRFRVKRLPPRIPSSDEPHVVPHRELTDEDRKAIGNLAARLQGEIGERIGGLASKQLRRGDREGVCPDCGGPMKAGHTACPFCRQA